MTTYEDLVAATLPHGLMPLVVPQLKTITLGGAVTGLGIESSSFRNGTPHESVLDMDVLTGAGEVLRVTPDGEHAELFAAFPNSYGTLGYALRLRIELEPVHPFVHLRHVPCGSVAEAAALMTRACAARRGGLRRRDVVRADRGARDARVVGRHRAARLGLHPRARLLPLGAVPRARTG